MERLLEEYGEVWFYVPDEYRSKFCEELIFMEMRFVDGNEITQKGISLLMSISLDKKVGSISPYTWRLSLAPGKGVPKVNYEKYVTGEEDYWIQNPQKRKYTWDDVEIID